ncbi:MAG: MFS transporter [Rhodobacterales bacterium]|nr:MAG: MFS transporter [Rhodobacterales bacterium]
MSKFLKLTTATAIAASLAAPVYAEKFGLGRAATPDEVAAWDKDVLPDGTGLPDGSGNAIDGEEIFAEHCAVCHGDFAEGSGNWPKLAGGEGTLADEDPLKTVGSYWPYLSTTFDYVRRSMPFGAAQTMSDSDTYAITAYILYSNDIIEDDFELSRETFLDVVMPNADGFIVDDRATTEAHFIREPCMEGCLEGKAKITRNVVFPGDPNAGVEAESASAAALKEASAAPAATKEAAPAATEEAAAPVEAEAAPVVAALDPELVKKGEKVFKKCKACHQVGEGAKNKTGPILTGIVGASFASVEGFKYSKAIKAMAEEGMVWDEANVATFLKKPKAFIKKTKMSFAGLKKDKDIAAVTEYLKSVSQ